MRDISPDIIKAMYSPESSEDLITLVEFRHYSTGEVLLRLADNYTQRLSADEEKVIYGVKHQGEDYIFLPMSIPIPDSELRTTLSIQDPTRTLIPYVRTLTSPPPEIVLKIVPMSSPDTVEIEIDSIYLNSVNGSGIELTIEMSAIDLHREGMPQHTIAPSYFPGLFS